MKLKTIFKIFILAVVLSFAGIFATSCGDGQLDQATNAINAVLPDTLVAISKPENNQVVDLNGCDILGNTFDENNTVSSVDIYFTSVFGGATNTTNCSIAGGELTTFRAKLKYPSEGHYYLWAIAKNSLNKTKKSKLIMIKAERSTNVDDVAPSIAIISPANNEEVGFNYTFSGTVSDNSSGVDKVYVKTDSGSFSEASFANNNWSKSITLTAYGQHKNYVYAVDKAGNISGTKEITVNCVSGTPSVSITSPANGAMVSGTTITVAGTASVDSPNSISEVHISANGMPYSEVDSYHVVGQSVNWTKDNVSLNNGANIIKAKVIANNDKTNTTEISITKDGVAPTITVSSPYNNQSFTNTTITVSGTASDNLSGVSAVYLAVNDNGYSAVDGTTTWSRQITLADGSHALKLYAKDGAGNDSFVQTINISISSGGGGDTNGPTVVLSTPTSNGTVSDATVLVSGTASDDSGVIGVYVALDSTSFETATGTTNWSKSLTVTYGAHIIKIYAVDSKGNVSATMEVPITRQSTGEWITIHYDNANSWTTPMMHWGFGYYLDVSDMASTGTDAFGSYYEVDWSGSTETELNACFNNNNSTWDGDDRAVSKPGSFPSEVWIKANDATVYTENPNDIIPPTVSLTSPVNGATLEGTVTINANASDNVGVSKVEFYYGVVKIGEDTSLPYSIDWNTLGVADGSYSLTAKAFDGANNSATSTPVNVTTDNTNALPIANAGTDIYAQPGSTVQFDGSGSYDPNGSIVSYSWDNGLTGVSPTTVYSTMGEYTVVLTVTDNEGDIGTDTVTVTVTTNIPDTSVFTWDNATVYFVITDRFYNGNIGNDYSYGRQQDGGDEIGTFHGGDLAGLTAKLNQGYFTNLGINAIWITAPYEQVHGWCAGGSSGDFKHYAYHGYYVQDFTMIDANMGTTNELKTFIDTAHGQNIRVVFDIVINHTGYNTLKDMDEYQFGGLNPGWENAESYNVHDYIDYNSDNWVNWWGPEWIRAGFPGYTTGSGDLQGCLAYLPDFKTEATYNPVHAPTFIANHKQGSTRVVDRYSDGWSVRDYLVNWLSNWVVDYGVDGFRCDTAKHVELEAWQALKTANHAALEVWRGVHGSPFTVDNVIPGDDDFWMTGEVFGHGVGRSTYFDNGFDSLINFSFQGHVNGGIGNYSGIEGTYESYANSINSDDTFNMLSYISSHDTSIFYNGDNNRQKQVGSLLMLCPGAVQIYYGDENCRPFGATGSDSDQGTRSSYQWPGNTDVLGHWQKVGRFRNRHVSVGAGSHQQITSSPYTFKRVYNKNSIEDKVVCVLGASGSTTVNVSSVWADGTLLRDYYSDTPSTATVSGGNVTFTPSGDTILIEEAN